MMKTLKGLKHDWDNGGRTGVLGLSVGTFMTLLLAVIGFFIHSIDGKVIVK